LERAGTQLTTLRVGKIERVYAGGRGGWGGHPPLTLLGAAATGGLGEWRYVHRWVGGRILREWVGELQGMPRLQWLRDDTTGGGGS